MKFGKQIQSQQIPTWSIAYLDYKGLKKIINSLAKGRPADAALLAAGVSPDLNKNNLISHQDQDHQPQPLVINGDFSQPDAESNLKAHKAAFFFKLERELEKINAFYLQKEADLKVRLRTLIDKRKIVQLSRTRKMTKTNSSFTTLYEGFRNFEKDLRKLQTFVEINQTGFRKILKKWDKRSKSTTKELYLARQVEVQPVFNRECIAELNDVAAANVLELEELLLDSDDHDSRHWSSNPSADGIPSDRIIPLISNQETDVEMDVIEFEEFETSLSKAVQENNREQVQELLRNLHLPSSPIDQSAPLRNRISRILWKAALHEEDSPADVTCPAGKANRMSILTPSSAMMDQELIPASRLDFSFVDDISGSINQTGQSASQDASKSGSSFMTGTSSELQGNDLDVDLIPDLSLPPPIMPFRIYGHNYLDKKALIQLSLGHPNTSRTLRPVVQLYGQPELTSLKLVISNRADPSSAVHSTILPLDYEHESFAFHTDTLDQFALEFDLFPTFGTRIMGKAAALPSMFRDSWNHKSYVLPLLDKHLKVIGEVAFELNVISPFQGVQLSLGGRVETYWKATSNVSGVGPGMGGITTASIESPIASPAGTPSTHHPTMAFVTASSLSGEYVRVVVQVTRDGVPVVYPKATLSLGGLDVQICALTSEQFNTLAIQLKRTLDDIVPDVLQDYTAARWHTLISQSMTCLKEILIRMPSRFGLNLEIESGKIGNRGGKIEATIGHCNGLDPDTLVDAVLKTIYEAAETNDRTGSMKLRRRLVLSSLDPSVCTALNWKQPNYAVFFASYCGVAGLSSDGRSLLSTNREIDDRRCSSMIEATRFAKANNLLGVMFDATLLLRVPSVVQRTKELGLLLTTFGDEVVIGTDGRLSDEGVLKYTMNDSFESVG
ncbi:SPX domain-containing protein [Melampsora americana]|nr:SPX domain-containing protein [Melampsora americana]